MSPCIALTKKGTLEREREEQAGEKKNPKRYKNSPAKICVAGIGQVKGILASACKHFLC